MSQKGAGYPFVRTAALSHSAWSPLVLAPAEAKPSVLPAKKGLISAEGTTSIPHAKNQFIL